MNVCILVGRLGADPHVKNQGVYFTLAVKQEFKRPDGSRGAEFLSMSAYGHLKESVEEYLRKGDKIAVLCQAQSYRKEDAEQVIFKIRDMKFLDVKSLGKKRGDYGGADPWSGEDEAMPRDPGAGAGQPEYAFADDE